MLQRRITAIPHSPHIRITRTATPLTRIHMPIPHTVLGIPGRISIAAMAVTVTATPIIAVGPARAFTGAVAVSMVAASMAVDLAAVTEVSVLARTSEPLPAPVAAFTLSVVAGDRLLS